MGIVKAAPVAGISWELAGQARPLVLRNREIERFEERHNPLSIFAVVDGFAGLADMPQARHCRDLVALGLIGAGMAEALADAIVAQQPPSKDAELKRCAQALVFAAYLPAPDDDTPGKPQGDGLSAASPAGDGTSPPGSEA